MVAQDGVDVSRPDPGGPLLDDLAYFIRFHGSSSIAQYHLGWLLMKSYN
jgi:hypothetical protein